MIDGVLESLMGTRERNTNRCNGTGQEWITGWRITRTSISGVVKMSLIMIAMIAVIALSLAQPSAQAFSYDHEKVSEQESQQAQGIHSSEHSRADYSVALLMTESGWCQGVHLAPGIILTAGHCHKMSGGIIGWIPVYELYKDYKELMESHVLWPFFQVVTHEIGDIALAFYHPSPWGSNKVPYHHYHGPWPILADEPLRVEELDVEIARLKFNGDLTSYFNIKADMTPATLVAPHLVNDSKNLYYLLLPVYSRRTVEKISELPPLCEGQSGAPVFSSSADPDEEDPAHVGQPLELIGFVSKSPQNASEFINDLGHLCSNLALIEQPADYYSWIASTIKDVMGAISLRYLTLTRLPSMIISLWHTLVIDIFLLQRSRGSS